MKKEKTDSNEKLYWIIGCSLIVFLVLVLISVILLRNTRDKIEGLGENEKTNVSQTGNFVIENGVKRSINPDITRAEIDVDNVRFSNFTITEKEEKSTLVDADISDISFTIENMDETPTESESYIVTVYGEGDEVIVEFTVRLENIPAREPTLFKQRLVTSCVDAVRIDVRKKNMDETKAE